MTSTTSETDSLESSARGSYWGDTTWGDRLVWLSLISTALPAIYQVEWKLSLGIGGVYVSDITLLMGALFSVRYIKATPYVGILFAGGLAASVIGWWNAAAPDNLLGDARGFGYLIAGMVIGTRICQRPQSLRFGFRALTVLVAITAGLAVITQVSDSAIVGRESGVMNAVYYNGEQTLLSGNRIQSEPVLVTLLLLCFMISAWILNVDLRRLSGHRFFWLAFVSSSVLTLFAYSRNSIVGIAVAVAVSALIPYVSTRSVRIARVLRASVYLLVFVGIPVAVGYGMGYFSGIVDTFSGRVVTGLSFDVMSTDPSVGWRFIENRAGLEFALNHPILGSGFGAYYRDYISGEPFQDDFGMYYMHNYFLTIFVKFGLLGGAFVLLLILSSVRRLVTASRDRFPFMAPAGCAFAALCVVSVVAPAMHSRSFAAFGGALVACALYYGRAIRRDRVNSRYSVDVGDIPRSYRDVGRK